MIIIYLGHLKLFCEDLANESHEKSHSNILSLTDTHFYDIFSLQISSFKIFYTKNYEEFLKDEYKPVNNNLSLSKRKIILSQFSNEIYAKKKKLSVKIVKKLDLSAKIQILKEECQLYTEIPKMDIKIDIGELTLGIYSSVLREVKRLASIMKSSFENSEDLLLFEKKRLLEKALKIGIMKKYESVKGKF